MSYKILYLISHHYGKFQLFKNLLNKMYFFFHNQNFAFLYSVWFKFLIKLFYQEMKRRDVNMKVIIVYETKFGNTKLAAEAIGEGLTEEGHDVVVKYVKDIDVNEAKDFDMIIVGSPTYVGRHAGSIKKFISKLSDVNLEGKSIAAFDTNISGGEGKFLRKAVFKMEKQIMKKIPGIKKAIDGLQVGVQGIKGPLIEGELEKCKEFGKKLASANLV